MRPQALAGIILIVLAVLALVQGGIFTEKHSLLEIGDLEVAATERHSIPPWVAGVGLVAGIALVGTGLKSKR